MSLNFCETRCPFLRDQELRFGGLWGPEVNQNICPGRAVTHLEYIGDSFRSEADGLPTISGETFYIVGAEYSVTPSQQIAGLMGQVATNMANDFRHQAVRCAENIEANPETVESDVLTVTAEEFGLRFSGTLVDFLELESRTAEAYYHQN